MIVMPASNTNAFKINQYYPGRMGLLFGPGDWKNPRGLPYALDNGRFAVWSKGRKWDEALFSQLLARAASSGSSPRWIVVPDVVADAVATFEQWAHWEPRLRNLGWQLALAVQDGMSPETVRRYSNPDVIFVGGSTPWKRNTLWAWCREFPRVHVGRVNTEKWLWNAHRCGAESCDGTGFFRGCQAQLRGLHRYLRRSSNGMGVPQLELEFARTFGGKVPQRSCVEWSRHERLDEACA